MKYAQFLLVLLFPIFANAASILNFSFANKIYSSDDQLILNFLLNSCRQQFKIRPTTDIGKVEIFNQKTLTWIGQNEPWDKFPFVQEKMRIRFSNIQNKKVLLKIESQNVLLGEITASKELPIWISDAYKDYINSVNENIALQTSQSGNDKLTR
jgi:hypothetical protein